MNTTSSTGMWGHWGHVHHTPHMTLHDLYVRVSSWAQRVELWTVVAAVLSFGLLALLLYVSLQVSALDLIRQYDTPPVIFKLNPSMLAGL